MKLVFYMEGENIIKKGQEINKLIILLNGEIRIDEQSKVFEPGNIFFDEVLVKKEKVYSTENYKVAKGKGRITVAEISFET